MAPRSEPYAPPLTPQAHQARLADPLRVDAVRNTVLVDGASAPVLDRLTRIASVLLDVPISLVTLVDDLGQHFPGATGLAGWAGERRGTPMAYSFCQHVVANDTPFIVENSPHDARVADSPAIPEFNVMAYAGVPLRSSDGQTLGAFCAVDTAPRTWTATQMSVLEDLASAAMAEIELRTTMHALLASQEQLRQQAMRDPLTGLLNRRGFSDMARQHLALAQRSHEPFCVVAMDLDAFKAINDVHGHDAGDEALVEMAALLTQCARESDLVARMGGDEFLVLLTGTDRAQSQQFIARLRGQMDAFNAEPGHDYRLASSMGVGYWATTAPRALGELLNDADTAMYEEKRLRRTHAA